MQSQRTRDTKPEMEIRRGLHALGLRYFVDRSPLPRVRRRADIVFPIARVAVLTIVGNAMGRALAEFALVSGR